MRTAPPLTVAAVANPAWSLVVSVLAMVSVAAVTVWLASPGGADSPVLRSMRWGAWLVTVALAVWAVWADRRQPVGELRWDGQAWFWQDGGTPDAAICRLRVAIDFGRWILLRCVLPRGSRWLALQRRPAQAAQWHALRCALYAAPPQA